MEFKHTHASFELKDAYTVREQLAYKSRVYSGIRNGQDDTTYADMWRAAVPLLENWQSELVPDPTAVDLDTDERPEVADLVFWVGNKTSNHMHTLGLVPKN